MGIATVINCCHLSVTLNSCELKYKLNHENNKVIRKAKYTQLSEFIFLYMVWTIYIEKIKTFVLVFQKRTRC